MGLIDPEMKQKHAQEERLLRFGEFVKAQKEQKSPGMAQACLQSEGYRDFYGKLVFGTGMHRHMWIISLADNPKAVLFDNKKEAVDYAKKLEKLLRSNGYPFSKARAEQVAIYKSERHPYSGFILPTITYESADRFIIRMTVK